MVRITASLVLPTDCLQSGDTNAERRECARLRKPELITIREDRFAGLQIPIIRLYAYHLRVL